MRDKGYYGIGIEQGKYACNYWTLFRTAQIFDAAFLFVIGKRFTEGVPDTMNSYRHIPIYSYKDFDVFVNHMPYNCKLIGVELSNTAENIITFQHPKCAIYLLGNEKQGLSGKAKEACYKLIVIPGIRPLNVSVAGSIVIYDRISKEYKKRLNRDSGELK